MKKFITERPWIWVVIAFILLIGAWSVFISIAVNNQPEKVPLGISPAEEIAEESEDARD